MRNIKWWTSVLENVGALKWEISVLESLENILKESNFEYTIDVALKWEM